jgi:hypothetical protein
VVEAAAITGHASLKELQRYTETEPCVLRRNPPFGGFLRTFELFAWLPD